MVVHEEDGLARVLVAQADPQRDAPAPVLAAGVVAHLRLALLEERPGRRPVGQAERLVALVGHVLLADARGAQDPAHVAALLEGQDVVGRLLHGLGHQLRGGVALGLLVEVKLTRPAVVEDRPPREVVGHDRELHWRATAERRPEPRELGALAGGAAEGGRRGAQVLGLEVQEVGRVHGQGGAHAGSQVARGEVAQHLAREHHPHGLPDLAALQPALALATGDEARV
mmetsp:Transcript_22703/g.71418  ORF Transcript_22703/g.71418 Transcript_22703/m.71418 type:complete len:227 (+) Transcript_22703:283-963(+)